MPQLNRICSTILPGTDAESSVTSVGTTCLQTERFISPAFVEISKALVYKDLNSGLRFKNCLFPEN